MNDPELRRGRAGGIVLARLVLVLDSAAEGARQDLAGLEAEFTKVAKAYSARQGISYAAWRAVGVPAAVLKKAGVTR